MLRFGASLVRAARATMVRTPCAASADHSSAPGRAGASDRTTAPRRVARPSTVGNTTLRALDQPALSRAFTSATASTPASQLVEQGTRLIERAPDST